MADLSFIVEEVKEDINQQIKNALNSVAHSAKDDIKNLRSQIIKQWFGEFDGSEFFAKDRQIVEPSFTSGDMWGVISFKSWTESSLIRNFETAQRWVDKYDGESPNEWVSHLIFDEGIIGLPLYSRIPNYNGMGWENGTNKNFHNSVPLSIVIEGHVGWIDIMDKISKDILSKIN